MPDFSLYSDDDLYSVLDKNREMWGILNEESVLNSHEIWGPVRDRCVRSLYFLSKFTWDSQPASGGGDAPISENLITWENHKHLLEMFVVKDPRKPIKDQSEIKNRLILYPRGTLKTSLGILDIIQWVLLDPTIRILVLTAADDLCTDIVEEIKGFFVKRNTVPTMMNLFWPEHCAEEKQLRGQGDFTTPEWTRREIKRREPTVMAKSILSTISGYHFDLVHIDDAVSDRNSGNDEQCEVVRKRYGLTRKTLRSFGYTTMIGTRYLDSDLWGAVLEQIETGTFTTVEHNICSHRIDNIEKSTIALIGAAMTIKPDAAEEMAKYNVPKRDWFRKAGRDGVVLLMPNVLGYDRLLAEYERDPEAFETQMRQNTTPPTAIVFTEELMNRACVHWSELPPFGRITQTWDFALGHRAKKYRDFTVGCACLWNDKGVGYVIDLVRDRFPTHVMLAKAIVAFACKHHPTDISIEDAGASYMLEPTIWAEADKTSDPYVMALVRRINWRQVDTKEGAKASRIGSLQPLLTYARLKFLNSLPYIKNLKEEFIKFTAKSSKHDDIPDVISFQMQYQPIPGVTEQDKDKLNEEKKRQLKEKMDQRAWEMIYNSDPQNNIVMQPEEKMIDDYVSERGYESGLDNMLGAGLTG